jgi:plastocyanin
MRTSTLLSLTLITLGAQAQTTHQLTNAGFTFNPPVITMQAGDSVRVSLPSPHTCTQVSQATWNANGNTPNGGFNFSSGTHTFALTIPGTYYYVCSPHANMGMKGQIIVLGPNSIGEASVNSTMDLFPNPATEIVHIDASVVKPGSAVVIYDLSGKRVMQVAPMVTTSVNVGNLTPGTYLMVVSDAKGALLLHERLVIAPQ